MLTSLSMVAREIPRLQTIQAEVPALIPRVPCLDLPSGLAGGAALQHKGGILCSRSAGAVVISGTGLVFTRAHYTVGKLD